jgi:hypothetical protein
MASPDRAKCSWAWRPNEAMGRAITGRRTCWRKTSSRCPAIRADNECRTLRRGAFASGSIHHQISRLLLTRQRAAGQHSMAQARASPGSFGVKRAVQLDDRFWPGQALPTRFVNSTRLPNGAAVNPRRLPSRLLIAAATLRVDGPSCVVTSTKNVGTPSDANDVAGVDRLGFAQPRPGPGRPDANLRLRGAGLFSPVRRIHARSKRSRFMTLVQAATKSRTNFCCASLLA